MAFGPEYTRETRNWLDQRFRQFDASGVYYAHQPIYGFRLGHCEPDLFDRYVRTYNIMRTLASIQFSSLLDVGCAEGYKAKLAEQFLGVHVTGCDLSVEACKRAREIFSVQSVVADIHDLPFDDGSFDVVLCSETLEHVADLQVATEELLRVARRAVVITVPHESSSTIERNLESGEPHAHIRALDIDSFKWATARGYRVEARKMLSRLLRLAQVLVEAAPREHHQLTKYPKTLFRLYNRATPLLKRILGPRAAGMLVQADDLATRLSGSYAAVVVVILKDSSASKPIKRALRPSEVIRFSMPLHLLNSNSETG